MFDEVFCFCFQGFSVVSREFPYRVSLPLGSAGWLAGLDPLGARDLVTRVAKLILVGCK